MTETDGSVVLHSPVEQEGEAAAVKDQITPENGPNEPTDSPETPQDAVKESASSDVSDSRDKQVEQQDGQADPPPALEPTSPETKEWRPGSRCRAVYSDDGLVYPAVVVWVKGQRCLVRYDDYNNEEEQDVSSLLRVNELHGPSRAASKGSRRMNTSNRRDEKPGERGERRSGWRDDQHASSWVKEKFTHKGEKEETKREGADKLSSHGFPVFPPFPPPHLAPGDSLPFIPPPPFAGKESVGSGSMSSMLMLWYMYGFHTGSYVTQQAFKAGSKD